MAFTGKEIHTISLSEAAAMTAKFRASVPSGSIIANYFGGQAITDILAQDGCVGIRIYYGLNDSGVPQLIITGVDANGNDLYQGLLAEHALQCPSCCSTSNPLNS